ncbi:bifunctional diguanylate cyclase/phosphodiesterase [Pseudoduganella armeniaca]|uniref:Bifunctional diguanylate cyclase/phosphodiesterase n=1 Tax=Pseudoduganella armeniaca TaxID=2072590 RepID=A0A2R4C9L1_9BURK|nr:EAL domain-containing protein [Pseudoduganella armeniaca]AVR96283.1 bifunctional diguanylate cyclase/phosphodiesterase [Pseudoduganella armeniaca]
MRRRLSSRVSAAAVLTLVAGVTVTGVLFYAVSALEYGKQSLGFQQRANLRVAAIRRGLDDAIEVLTVTNQLFRTLPPAAVTREQFGSFTRPLLQRYPFIQSFAYHRLLRHDERAAWERDVQRTWPGVTVRDLGPGGFEPAAVRAHYNVLDYFEPFEPNRATLGFDVGPLPQTGITIERVLRTGKPAATALISLAENPAQRHTFIILMPVYRPGAPTATPAQRHEAWVGDTAAMIHAPQLVHKILHSGGLLDDPQLALRVYAGSAQDGAGMLVYANGPDAAPVPGLAQWLPRWLDVWSRDRETRRFEVLGLEWHVRVDALPRPFLSDHLGSVSTLLGGTLFSILAAALMQTLSQRSRRVQWLVDARTADLQVTNEKLNADVAARKRTERALQESEHRFKRLLALSSDWYWEQDVNFCFTSITNGFFEKGRLDRADFIGHPRWHHHPEMLETAWGRAHMARLEARLPFSDLEYPITGKDGVTRWFTTNGEPVYDAHGEFRGYRGTGAEITERKLAEQRIQHIAHHDALTGLPNRVLLQDRLTQAVAYANRSGHALWVLLIDLDRFKFVNDTLGHKAGDQLLKTIAARLQSSVRESDTVARLSGDEFVAILSEYPEQSLSPDVVGRIMRALAQPVDLEGKEFIVTCSIGVAVYEGDGVPSKHLIEQADIAMYSAKKLGRNCYQFFEDSMNEEAQERLRIESALRNALVRQEFVLHYQPQLDLATGAIVGVEALLRWQHPELGMVAPQRFIGLAEETGLIVPIGAWVMRTACAQAQAWRAAGLPPLRMAVNLSARQFAQPDLVQSIAAVLAETGLPPACLELELTESLFVDDVARAVALLHELKNLGVALSIDDFGTGYSSLSYLRTFPIDVLKIDRTFVGQIDGDSDQAAIVVSIIALAHNLQLKVIAEGVETAEQLAFLRAHECDQVQGYYFSRPVPAEEFAALAQATASGVAALASA